jgi:CPA1 family monovalent cation:H+ antiporter
MHDTHFTISVFILLLLISSGVAMAAKWVRVPYTLMLVIVGLLISPMHFLPAVHISPELILLIFLPSLLFEAAWNLKVEELRNNFVPILLLAVPGVCISVGVIGALLHLGLGMSWSTALLFGSMVSATDPVSVLAIFRRLGLPQRLMTVMEGESLFNDGTSVVLFRIMLGIVAGAAAESPWGIVWGSAREFFLVVAGGVAVGAAVGFLASTVTSYFDDHLLEITLTTIAAYGSFLLAESLGVSPVIAVLIGGLVIGNYGRRIGMSPTTQVAVNSFWDYAAFVVNSLVFLLIGLEIQLPTLAEHFLSVVWAVAAMVVARGAAVYGLMPLSNRLTDAVLIRWQHVLFWGGLRGSLSIALVLSLPLSVPGRSQLVVMTFGAVMFSLLGQGLTVSGLLRALKFSQPAPEVREYELLQGRLLAETAALAELDLLESRGVVTEGVSRKLRAQMKESRDQAMQKLSDLQVSGHSFRADQTRRMRRHLLDVEKTRLSELLRDGIISEQTMRELRARMDQELAREEMEREEGTRDGVSSGE